MNYNNPTRPTYTRPGYNAQEPSAYERRESFFREEEAKRKIRFQAFLNGNQHNI